MYAILQWFRRGAEIRKLSETYYKYRILHKCHLELEIIYRKQHL